MRTHTTYTDLRRIMRLHGEGMVPKDISQEVFIDQSEIEHVISVRLPKKKAASKRTLTL